MAPARASSATGWPEVDLLLCSRRRRCAATSTASSSLWICLIRFQAMVVAVGDEDWVSDSGFLDSSSSIVSRRRGRTGAGISATGETDGAWRPDACRIDPPLARREEARRRRSPPKASPARGHWPGATTSAAPRRRRRAASYWRSAASADESRKGESRENERGGEKFWVPAEETRGRERGWGPRE
ncbi:unnamed protein product [Urochloa humidicola]